MTCCVKGCSNESRLNKDASYNKVLHEEIKFLKKDILKFLCKSKTTAIGKSLMKNRIKNRKYFSAQQYQNFRKYLRWSETDSSKEIKRMFQEEIFYKF